MSHGYTSSQGASDIVAERLRVLACEPYDATHDDRHTEGQLAVAAAELAIAHVDAMLIETIQGTEVKNMWGLLDKHRDTRRRLVVAGALIAAEIDRLDRLEAKR